MQEAYGGTCPYFQEMDTDLFGTDGTLGMTLKWFRKKKDFYIAHATFKTLRLFHSKN